MTRRVLSDSAMSPSVTVVVVNYNGHRDTIECLESLLRLDGAGTNVIVVDNGSSPASAEAILAWSRGATKGSDWQEEVWRLLPRERRWPADLHLWRAGDSHPTQPPRLRLVRSSENLGFAGANNLGASIALRDPACEHVWFLNNDTVVRPDALSQLVDRMRREPAVGMCGSTLMHYADPSVVQACGGYLNPVLGRGLHVGNGLSRAQLPSPDVVESRMNYVVGASLLVTRRFLEVVGPMEEDYFLYFEELDWATRARDKFTLAWAPGSIVFHKEGASIGTSYRGRASDTALYYQTVNLLRFNWRFLPFALPISLLRIVLLAVRFLLRKDRAGARLMALAIRDFVSGTKRRGPIGAA